MRASHNRIIPVTFFLLITIAASRAHAAGIPTDQIKATVDKAIVVLKDPRLKSETKTRERREQLKPILFARFDFAEMGKRALGSEWRRRTPTEQEEFVRLFTDLLEHAYAQTIESYTDNSGDASALEQLTQDRARVLSERLAAAGVDVTRIQASGMGAANPIAPNTTLANRSKNRRTEITLALSGAQ